MGHSEQASEQALHTAEAKAVISHRTSRNMEQIIKAMHNLQQKWRQGRRMAAVGDSKQTLHM